jgi:hypothetical protein
VTREEARKIQLAKIEAERQEIMRRNAETISQLEAKKSNVQPVQTTSRPRTFEVDGEQIPYEAEKCNDSTVSNAWKAIADANR